MDKATPPGKKQIFYGSRLGRKCKSARKGKGFDGILKISIIVRRPTNLNSEIPVLVSRVFSSSPHTRTGHRSRNFTMLKNFFKEKMSPKCHICAKTELIISSRSKKTIKSVVYPGFIKYGNREFMKFISLPKKYIE